MKKRLLSIVAILPMSLLAQIPNAGMENWSNGAPDLWSTNNISGVVTPITQTSDSYIGSSAVRMEVVSTGTGVLQGLLTSAGSGGNGFPVTQNYGSVSFYYKAGFLGNDAVQAIVYFSDANNQSTAGGSIMFANNQSVYTQAVVPIFGNGPNPVSCVIYLTFYNSVGVNAGSWAQFDDFALGGPVGVDEFSYSGITLSSPNPNPAAGIALVPFTLDRTTVTDIRIYDLNGRLVQNVLNQELNAGNYKAEVNADALAAGVYTIVMRAGDQVLQSKLVVR
ncbi:MAG: T9SS type A sorting domain-containing protein [Bacteroidia bacterium]